MTPYLAYSICFWLWQFFNFHQIGIVLLTCKGNLSAHLHQKKSLFLSWEYTKTIKVFIISINFSGNHNWIYISKEIIKKFQISLWQKETKRIFAYRCEHHANFNTEFWSVMTILITISADLTMYLYMVNLQTT